MTSPVFHNLNQTCLANLPSPEPSVRAFHRTLPDYAPTPLVSLPELANSIGVRAVLLKNETSRLGLPAFKILGASWATARAVKKLLNVSEGQSFGLDDLKNAAQAAGLVLYAASEGNHGRAVARMASYLGISARIFIPKMCDEAVKRKIESEGAEVVIWDGSYDDAVLGTKEAATKHEGGKGLLISDTALVEGDEVAQWIVDGYQTMFDEIEEQAAELRDLITHVLTPVGVGSLCQGVVTHFKRPERKRNVDVITVEPVVAACLKASLEANKVTSVDAGYTICSGMCCGTVYVYHGEIWWLRLLEITDKWFSDLQMLGQL